MRSSALRLALIQANPTVGAIASQFEAIKAHVLAQKDADLVIFPECFLSGYPLEDLVLRPSLLSEVRTGMEAIARWLAATGGPAVLLGAPVAGADLPLNAAHLITPGGDVHTIAKVELPNNDVFDERRTFAQGRNPKPLVLDGWRLGCMICEDMWHGRVTRSLADELVDILIVLNGSPFEADKQPIRLAHARERVRVAGKPLVYLNMVGGQDELVFDGASFALDAAGRLIAQMPAFREGVTRLTLARDNGQVTVTADRPLEAIHPYPDPTAATYEACVLGLRDYIEKNRFPHVLLGVSGGLDSALVAAMAADAIGPHRVYGIMMPAAYTGAESLNLAAELFSRIGLRNATIAIDEIHREFEAALDRIGASGIFETAPEPQARALASENFQPRTRGTLLMGVSNAFGGLVLSTGNKSEMSMGYATLYGDMCGGFNPLKDVYKTTAFALARWRNQHPEPWMKGPEHPIPDGIISRPPTAELKPDQTDEEALGAYEVLDVVLKLLVEDLCDVDDARLRASRILGRDVAPAYVGRIAALLKNAEYKRRQAPPGIKLTARAFGKGWRYPITNHAAL